MDNVVKYGNVSFADVQVGSIVKVGDYYGQVAVGVVEEKRETIDEKSVIVRFGLEGKNTQSVILEDKTITKGQPMYELLEIVRSYV